MQFVLFFNMVQVASIYMLMDLTNAKPFEITARFYALNINRVLLRGDLFR